MGVRLGTAHGVVVTARDIVRHITVCTSTAKLFTCLGAQCERICASNKAVPVIFQVVIWCAGIEVSALSIGKSAYARQCVYIYIYHACMGQQCITRAYPSGSLLNGVTTKRRSTSGSSIFHLGWLSITYDVRQISSLISSAQWTEVSALSIGKKKYVCASMYIYIYHACMGKQCITRAYPSGGLLNGTTTK